MRNCNTCKVAKPLDQFGVDRSSRTGLRSQCKSCTNLSNKRYLKNLSSGDMEKRKNRRSEWAKLYRTTDKGKSIQRSDFIRRAYGLTQDQYLAMLGAQGGVCKICGGVNPGGKRLNIDHCHTTGVVRGLLCHTCNMALGCFKDDVAVLEKAIKYLTELRVI